METKLPRFVFYEDEGFKLEIQELNDTVFLHCIASSWKLSILKRMYEVFSTLKEWGANAGYKRLATITPNPKFAKLFGGNTIREFEHEGDNLEVIIWELK